LTHPDPFQANDADDAPWTLPLHGVAVPGGESGPPDAIDLHLPPDEYVPPLDFQPRLSRFGEAA